MAVTQCATRIFRPQLVVLLRVGNTIGANIDEASSVLVMMNQLKRLLCEVCLGHEHVGVRTRAVKFVEILLLCYSLPDLRVPTTPSDAFHLLLVPSTHPLLVPSSLKDEGDALSELLVAQLQSASSASVAVAVVGALGVVARLRSAGTLAPLVRAMLRVVTEPPPALSASQVAALRSLIRVVFISLLKAKLIPLIAGKIVFIFIYFYLSNFYLFYNFL